MHKTLRSMMDIANNDNESITKTLESIGFSSVYLFLKKTIDVSFNCDCSTFAQL